MSQYLSYIRPAHVSSMLFHKVHEYLHRFRKYDWLWKDDKDVQYKRFVASNPAISDYEVFCVRANDMFVSVDGCLE